MTASGGHAPVAPSRHDTEAVPLASPTETGITCGSDAQAPCPTRWTTAAPRTGIAVTRAALPVSQPTTTTSSGPVPNRKPAKRAPPATADARPRTDDGIGTPPARHTRLVSETGDDSATAASVSAATSARNGSYKASGALVSDADAAPSRKPSRFMRKWPSYR